MTGLLRAKDVFATEPAAVVAVAIVVLGSIVAAVELGTTEVVATESLFDCAEHPAVTRIIKVSEVIILFFMKRRVPMLHCKGRVLRLRRSEECLGVR
jgi:hypothetical protein